MFPGGIVLFAALAAIAGLVPIADVLLEGARAPIVVAIGHPASLDGLTLTLERRQWIGEHAMQGMPASMAPGLPAAGQRRMHAELLLRNDASRAREFLPNEFTVRSSSGLTWSVSSSSFATGDLGPGHAIIGDLYFDVQAAAAASGELMFVWSRDGREVRVPIGAAPHEAVHP